MRKKSVILVSVLAVIVVAMIIVVIIRGFSNKDKEETANEPDIFQSANSISSVQESLPEPLPETAPGEEEEDIRPLTKEEIAQKNYDLAHYVRDVDNRALVRQDLEKYGTGPETFTYNGHPRFDIMNDPRYESKYGTIGTSWIRFLVGADYMEALLELEDEDFVALIMDPIVERTLLCKAYTETGIEITLQTVPKVDYENKTVSFMACVSAGSYVGSADYPMSLYDITASLEKPYATITEVPRETISNVPEEELFLCTNLDMYSKLEGGASVMNQQEDETKYMVINPVFTEDGTLLTPELWYPDNTVPDRGEPEN